MGTFLAPKPLAWAVLCADGKVHDDGFSEHGPEIMVKPPAEWFCVFCEGKRGGGTLAECGCSPTRDADNHDCGPHRVVELVDSACIQEASQAAAEAAVQAVRESFHGFYEGFVRGPLPRAKPVGILKTVAIALLALLPAYAHAWEPEYPATFQGVAAAGVSLSDESAAIPVLALNFNGPIVLGDEPVARLSVSLSLSGLPGETVDLQKPTTWKAAEVFGELQRRIGSDGQGGSTYLVGRSGFHTRILPSDKTPRQRYARSYGAGVRVERRDKEGSIRRSIALLYGRSDVASPQFDRGQVMLEGHAKLTTVAGVDVIIGGDAYLNVSRHAARGARDVLRVYVGAGWGG